MKITFIGAAHEVTGSCTLLTVSGKHYLIDCGMEQGKDEFKNIELPIFPADIEAVFLTHAHIDHSGMLPKLTKDGFKGRIYATETTCDLCRIMLSDSAHIQMAEAEWKTRKALRSGLPPVLPAYDLNDVTNTIDMFRGCYYGQIYKASEDIFVRFTDVGHLLGSACIELWLTENGETKKIVFSGDVGNTNQPILKEPQSVDEADFLVIESTYGNRLHERPKDTLEEFAGYIKRAFDRGGNVVIPSFAVGRTQELLYAIRELKQKGLLEKYGDFPVFIDSPLAAEATRVFLQCDESFFDEETLAIMKNGDNPLWFDGIELSVTADDSKSINLIQRPKIIISASGMCEAGRIRHHLKHNLWRKENVILFVGYQAEGSLGRRLIEGEKEVKLFGETINVEAEICMLHGTSGHADKNGLLNWVKAFNTVPPHIFVNHGEAESCEAFRDELIALFGVQAFAPYSGAEYDLTEEKWIYESGPVKVDRSSYGSIEKNSLFRTLVASFEKLGKAINTCKEKPNKELRKIIKMINDIIEKIG